MTKSVLILGASGKFGSAAATAFTAAGWQVTRFDRAVGDLRAAMLRADVVVNAWNPPDYTFWARDLLSMHRRVVDAAEGTDVTLIVPGNVYPFGAGTPAPWSESSPHAAQNPLGRLRIEVERAYRTAGLRTIVLRAGDFLDTRPSGNWFDLVLVKALAKGRFVYPGRTDASHAWAYLPDLARAATQLAERRAELPVFADIPFAGYSLTGAQMAQSLERITGRSLKMARLPWWALRLAEPFSPNFKHLREMRYLWDTPHALDGRWFDSLVPEFQPTPLDDALRCAIAHTGALSAAGEVQPNKTVAVEG